MLGAYLEELLLNTQPSLILCSWSGCTLSPLRLLRH